MRLRIQKFFTLIKYKKQQLIKHQLFIAVVDIKSLLKVTRPSYFVSVLPYFEALWYPTFTSIVSLTYSMDNI